MSTLLKQTSDIPPALLLRLLNMLDEEEKKQLAGMLGAAEELKRVAPTTAVECWHSENTSQRETLKLCLNGIPKRICVRGGSRAGKSTLGALFLLLSTAGRDAVVSSSCFGRVYWVGEFLERLGLPVDCVKAQPGTSIVGSQSFTASIEQARKILQTLAPIGTRFQLWPNDKEAKMFLPGGGIIVSKAFEQFDKDVASWEGTKTRAFWLDEEPKKEGLLDSVTRGTVDEGGRGVITMSPLSGETWVKRRFIDRGSLTEVSVAIHGADNPNIDQEAREDYINSGQPWLREARDKGDFCSPAGAVFPGFDKNLMTTKHLPVPNNVPHYRALDWGTWSPHILWCCRLTNGPHKGKLYFYREYAPRIPVGGVGITDEQLIDKCIEIEKRERDNVDYGIADAQGKNSILQAAKRGLMLFPCVKYDGSVRDQIDSMCALMYRKELLISRDCPVFISELSNYKWAMPKVGEPVEPVKKDDHGVDAACYLIHWQKKLGGIS